MNESYIWLLLIKFELEYWLFISNFDLHKFEIYYFYY